ncbi:M24 family metallopeptidase [Candidatus Poriferisodalis sp.]|uniref:M24 family metallopeptidase n=1 Tax=Candidatus Poriferisodalis sp. TaxID=3101277 RepID=UPI003B01E8DB
MLDTCRFRAGPDEPAPAQRQLHRLARDRVTHNLGIIGPGVTFREHAQRAWDIPESYRRNRCCLSAHGCGMTGEYPCLYHRADSGDAGYDGVIEPGMTLCVESCIGRERDRGREAGTTSAGH